MCSKLKLVLIHYAVPACVSIAGSDNWKGLRTFLQLLLNDLGM
jgi:hypothetical protein